MFTIKNISTENMSMPGLPTYMRIRQYVNDLMMTHADREVRIMSERELCKEFNVTRPTARHALKELIDEGILCAKPGLGTFINSAKMANHSFTLRKSYKIMVIFGNGRSADLDGFYMDILARINDCLKHLPVRLRMANLNQADRAMALEELNMYNPDGIIWVRPSIGAFELIKVVRRRIPVYITGHIANGDNCGVTADYYHGGRLAAAWFLGRNLRDVLFVGWTAESRVKSEVLKGWKDEFSARRIIYDESLMVNLECNIINQCKCLLGHGGVNGIFSFGSEFTAVDIALTETGVDTAGCPVVFDENYYAEYGASMIPAAKIILLPPATSELAAVNLFKMLTEPDFKPEEIVFSPKIENINQKSKEGKL